MKNNLKKFAAVISATILSAIPMAGSLTANAALANDNVKYVFGDLNYDGKVNTQDASRVLQGAGNMSADQKKRADVNGDGKITDADAKMINQYYADSAAGKKIYGDADNNGKVNLNDVAKIIIYMNGTTKSINLIAADVNADGVINKCDYKLVERYACGDLSTLYVNWGDVDSDGSITTKDIFRLANYVDKKQNVNLTNAEKRRADINLDGKINDDDVTALLMRASVGYFMWAK